MELKQFKAEMEDIKKEKNRESIEKGIRDLNEFKRKKLNEETEEKARQKKELTKGRKIKNQIDADAHSKESQPTLLRNKAQEIKDSVQTKPIYVQNPSLINNNEDLTTGDDVKTKAVSNGNLDIENKCAMKHIGTKVEGIEENGALENDLEDVNSMSDKDFSEYLWKKFYQDQPSTPLNKNC